MKILGNLFRLAIITVITSPVWFHYTRNNYTEWALQAEPLLTLAYLDDWLTHHAFGILSSMWIILILLFLANKIRLGGNL